MRTCLVFILAIMLSLNAAYAAAAGVCDVFEQTHGHALHFGHHSHEHGDGHDAHSDGAGEVHCHDHAHSGFSSILPGIVGVMPLTGCSPLVALPPAAFISAPQAPIDLPPRATPA